MLIANRLLATAAALLGMQVILQAQTPLNTNLLTNAGFENQLAQWTNVAGTATTVVYGSGAFPGTAFAQHLGAGGRMAADQSGNAVIEQSVSLNGVPANAHVYAAGYFGGGGNDGARMVVRFLAAGGVEISRHELDGVTQTQRNFESALLRREARIPIPAGTTHAAARVEFTEICCSGVTGAADLLTLELQIGSLLPPPKPFGSNLLANASFEQGWAAGSPLTPAVLSAWEGAGTAAASVVAYGATPEGLTPSVSCLIGGGLDGLHCLPGGSGNYVTNNGLNAARLKQRIDLRGNTAQFATPGAVALRLNAFLGGYGAAPDTTSLNLTFLSASLVAIAPVTLVGHVTPGERNQETVLVARGGEFPVPPSTAYADVELVLQDICCSGLTAAADAVDARLVPFAATQPAQYGSNLIANGSFEGGSLPASPLQLTNKNGWAGLLDERADVPGYGTLPTVPSTAFAAANSLGSLLLRDLTANGALRQTIDVSGNKSAINQGLVNGYVQAWLGGFSADLDNARVEVTCLNEFDAQVGGPGSFIKLGPVTATDRANQTTLLLRQQTFLVPAGTAKIRLEIRFEESCCSGSNAMVDDIRLVLSESSAGPNFLPGTGEDLRLLTGVNGPVTAGPGNESKLASGGDLLTVNVVSPNSTYLLGKLLLGATGYLTGAQFSTVPGIQLNPSSIVFLLNGLACQGFGCPVVLPGGMQVSYLLPSGLAGLTIRLQGFALAPVGSGVVPANGAFASTEAHEIVMQ